MQEYQEYDLYAAGNYETELVDFGKIDTVPVSILHGEDDFACILDLANQIYEGITSPGKSLFVVPGDHGTPVTRHEDAVVTELIRLIETGDMDKSVFPEDDDDWWDDDDEEPDSGRIIGVIGAISVMALNLL